jgi:hypothetical protein
MSQFDRYPKWIQTDAGGKSVWSYDEEMAFVTANEKKPTIPVIDSGYTELQPDDTLVFKRGPGRPRKYP